MLTFVKEQLEARCSIIIGERKHIPSFIDQRRGKCHEDVNPLDLFAPRIKPIMNTTCFDDQLHSTEVIVLSVWLSASGVAAQCSGKYPRFVVVLQTRVTTNNFQPFHSLVVGSRFLPRAPHKSRMDSCATFQTAARNRRFGQDFGPLMDSHHRDYNV